MGAEQHDPYPQPRTSPDVHALLPAFVFRPPIDESGDDNCLYARTSGNRCGQLASACWRLPRAVVQTPPVDGSVSNMLTSFKNNRSSIRRTIGLGGKPPKFQFRAQVRRSPQFWTCFITTWSNLCVSVTRRSTPEKHGHPDMAHNGDAKYALNDSRSEYNDARPRGAHRTI